MDVENAFNSGVNAILYDGDIEKLKKELEIYGGLEWQKK